MPDPAELSRRERQIMDAVFALGEATVNRVVETIPDPPTAMAVRRMMHILEELRATAYSTVCPHGRPVMLRLTKRRREYETSRSVPVS